eukprot:jgi/Botrbrau1/23313/Bobra.0102s0051.1
MVVGAEVSYSHSAVFRGPLPRFCRPVLAAYIKPHNREGTVQGPSQRSCRRLSVRANANNEFLDRLKRDVNEISKDVKKNVQNVKSTADTVAKGVKDASQVLRGTASEVVAQVKDHATDLTQLKNDMESSVTSYMDPHSLKEAKELLKDRIKDMEPKVDNMIDSLPTNRQDLARTIKKAVVTNMQALDKVLDHTVGEDPAPSKDSPPKSLAPPTPKNP